MNLTTLSLSRNPKVQATLNKLKFLKWLPRMKRFGWWWVYGFINYNGPRAHRPSSPMDWNVYHISHHHKKCSGTYIFKGWVGHTRVYLAYSSGSLHRTEIKLLSLTLRYRQRKFFILQLVCLTLHFNFFPYEVLKRLSMC